MEKKKKKALIISLSIVGVIILAATITLIVLLTRKPETPPAGGSNTIYQTKAEKFWAGTGSGYMSFDYEEEPAEKEEGVLYGYVFRVYAFNDGAWQPWLSGTWQMNTDETKLTLTASWSDEGQPTKLADATSGTPKEYTAENGRFKIGVDYPGGATGKVTFTLDPVADKVGDDVTPPTNCTNHVDENDDGKCDICDEDMPVEVAELMVTLEATDAITTMAAEIKMYDDKTFEFILEAMKVFGGTWTSSDETGANPMAPLTLTVDGTGSPVVGETITITITPAIDYSYMTYTCHVDYVVPEVISMAFDFTGTFIV